MTEAVKLVDTYLNEELCWKMEPTNFSDKHPAVVATGLKW